MPEKQNLVVKQRTTIFVKEKPLFQAVNLKSLE